VGLLREDIIEKEGIVAIVQVPAADRVGAVVVLATSIWRRDDSICSR
jgi:hypothetical protein